MFYIYHLLYQDLPDIFFNLIFLDEINSVTFLKTPLLDIYDKTVTKNLATICKSRKIWCRAAPLNAMDQYGWKTLMNWWILFLSKTTKSYLLQFDNVILCKFLHQKIVIFLFMLLKYFYALWLRISAHLFMFCETI